MGTAPKLPSPPNRPFLEARRAFELTSRATWHTIDSSIDAREFLRARTRIGRLAAFPQSGYHTRVIDSQRFSPLEIEKRLAPLFARPEVNLVLLFGSYATGRARPASDIDLAILAEGEFEAINEEVIRGLGTDRADVVDLRYASPLLAMVVARQGRRLYERARGAFAAFASLALRRYNDTAKLRRLREKGIKDFLSERGL